MTYNNETLRLFREYRGLSQKKFADYLGISQTVISKIEKGLRPLDQEIVNKLSTSVDESFFLQNIENLNLKIYYRQSSSTAKSTTDLFESRLTLIANHISHCLKEIEAPENQIPSIDLNEFGLNPEALAMEVRQLFGLGISPIKDIVQLLESKGIFIHFFDYPFVTPENKTLDGVSFFIKGTPVILVNNKIQNARKVFTIAHELGHLIMHLNYIVESVRDEESEANKFASEFIAPKRALNGEFTRLTLEKLFMLKSYWKMSIGALLYKAKDVSLTTDQYRRWVTHLSAYRKNEPHDIDLTNPKNLKKCFAFFKDNLHQGDENSFYRELGINKQIFDDLYSTFHEKRKLRIIY